MTVRIAVALLCSFAAVARGESPGAAIGRGEVQRILFLGDSITWDGRYVGDVEAWLTLRYPGMRVEVINAGLPSETVSGLSEEGHAGGAFPRPWLHGRLDGILSKARPDWIFACYGMNCGIYQPFDEARFAAYRDGIAKLREAAITAGASLTLITPPVYDVSHAGAAGLADYDEEVLGRYSAWLVSKRAGGWEVIDLHSGMAAELGRRQAAQPDFAFSADGVHPGDAGHWFIAQQVIGYLGESEAAAAASSGEMLGANAGVLPLAVERMRVLRDAWLSYTGHARPGMPKGMEIDEARTHAAELTARIEAIAGSGENEGATTE